MLLDNIEILLLKLCRKKDSEKKGKEKDQKLLTNLIIMEQLPLGGSDAQ